MLFLKLGKLKERENTLKLLLKKLKFLLQSDGTSCKIWLQNVFMHLSEDEITDKVSFKCQTVKKIYVYKFSNSCLF